MDDQSCPQTTDQRDIMEKKKKKKVKTVSFDDRNNHQLEEGDYDFEDGDHDDGKMVKFFELITSFREARNRLRKGVVVASNNYNNQEKKNETKKRKQPISSAAYDDGDNGGRSSWIPSFEREDFTSQLEFRGIPSIFPTPNNSTNTSDDQFLNLHCKPKLNDGLNLNLSL